MQAFLDYVIKALVDRPDAVSVTPVEENGQTVYELRLHPTDVGKVIESAIGGENIAITIEGRERYPINVRYLRELRDDPQKLQRVLVDTPTGVQVPLAQLTTLRFVNGPPMIRDENGMLAGYVFLDMTGRDVGGYVDDLKRVVRESGEKALSASAAS